MSRTIVDGAPRRPIIWVSRCLLGDRVRYDGGHKRNARLVALRAIATLVPICPELEAGLGVPRPPIDLVGDRVVDRAAARDVTDLLDAAIDGWLARSRPDGFIGKGRSPSCGHGTARRYAPDGRADGRFVRRLTHTWPDLPVTDIEALTDEFLLAIWRRAGVDPGGLLDLIRCDAADFGGRTRAAARLGDPVAAPQPIAKRSERELLVLSRDGAGSVGGAEVRRRTTEDPT